ncbi:Uncharacterised protein [Mycobacteroides abscessus subsp. abscessus]|nr:Uncharacterised protein [Mycobacteroides abscessus subsp. abscessus]
MHSSTSCLTSTGVRPEPRTTSSTGAPRFTAILALKRSSLGLATSV